MWWSSIRTRRASPFRVGPAGGGPSRWSTSGELPSPTLRAEVRACLTEMHDLFRRGHTPKVKPARACSACSLKDLCLPRLLSARSVSDYLRESLEVRP